VWGFLLLIEKGGNVTPMGTKFSEIYDLFMTLQNDFRLAALYESSELDFETYLTAWLDFAIADFSNCDQSLAYTLATKTFTEVLTMKNQLILARIMVKYWLSKEVQDVTQMSIHIQDRDFKTFSEAQNLTAKSNNLNMVKEDISQALVDYGLNTIDWATWLTGTFYVP
jgi:hypothetical protein